MVQNKFASDDPYVLPLTLQTATSNAADLNVIVQESDYLKATSISFQQQGLTGTLANPVPNVTVVGQQTVGNALYDGTLSPDGEPIDRGPRSPILNPNEF